MSGTGPPQRPFFEQIFVHYPKPEEKKKSVPDLYGGPHTPSHVCTWFPPNLSTHLLLFMITANGRKLILSGEQRFRQPVSSRIDRSGLTNWALVDAHKPQGPRCCPWKHFSSGLGSMIGFFTLKRISSIVRRQSREQVMPAQLTLMQNSPSYDQSSCAAIC
jgi:hypothetical protein